MLGFCLTTFVFDLYLHLLLLSFSLVLIQNLFGLLEDNRSGLNTMKSSETEWNEV